MTKLNDDSFYYTGIPLFIKNRYVSRENLTFEQKRILMFLAYKGSTKQYNDEYKRIFEDFSFNDENYLEAIRFYDKNETRLLIRESLKSPFHFGIVAEKLKKLVDSKKITEKKLEKIIKIAYHEKNFSDDTLNDIKNNFLKIK